MTDRDHREPAAGLSVEELRRYSRHLLIPQVGKEGQQRLKRSSVLLVGAGGLGSPLALYLAAAGVGRLGLVDFDTVDETNLQRQIIHTTGDIGRPKLDSAGEKIAAVNPHVEVVPHPVRLASDNALGILDGYDVVVDGTDNFPTRYLVNDACVLLGKPDVYGSVFRFEGQVAVFDAARGPCYRCLFPEPPPPGSVPSCAEGGVLGILPGIIGTLQANETVKLLLGIGDPLVGRILLFDALALEFRSLRLARDPACPVCGEHPTVTSLIDYEAFCGAAGAGTAVPEMNVARAPAAPGRGAPPRRPRALRAGDRPHPRGARGAAGRAPGAAGRAGPGGGDRGGLPVRGAKRPGGPDAAGRRLPAGGQPARGHPGLGGGGRPLPPALLRPRLDRRTRCPVC